MQENINKSLKLAEKICTDKGARLTDPRKRVLTCLLAGGQALIFLLLDHADTLADELGLFAQNSLDRGLPPSGDLDRLPQGLGIAESMRGEPSTNLPAGRHARLQAGERFVLRSDLGECTMRRLQNIARLS